MGYALMYSFSMSHLNANLRQLLETGRISVGRLASICDMQQPTLFRILNRPDREPRIRTIEPIAALLGVSVHDLMFSDLREPIAARGPYPWPHPPSQALRPEPDRTKANEPATGLSMLTGEELGEEVREAETSDRDHGHAPLNEHASSTIGPKEVFPSKALRVSDYAQAGGILSPLEAGRQLAMSTGPHWDPTNPWFAPSRAEAMLAHLERNQELLPGPNERQIFLTAMYGKDLPEDRPWVKIHKARKLLDWRSEFVAATFVSTLPVRPPRSLNLSKWDSIKASASLERGILRMALIRTTSKRLQCVVLALIGQETPINFGEQRIWEAAQLGVDVYFVRSGAEAAETLQALESFHETLSSPNDEIADLDEDN